MSDVVKGLERGAEKLPDLERHVHEILAYLNWQRIDRALTIGGWFIAEPWLSVVPAGASAAAGFRLSSSITTALLTGVLTAILVSKLWRFAVLKLQLLATQTGGLFVPETERHEAACILDALADRLRASGRDPVQKGRKGLLSELLVATSKIERGPSRSRNSSASFDILPDHAFPALLGVWFILITAVIIALRS